MRKLVVISGALVMALLSAGTVMSQEATGACCKADGSCTVMTASDCALAGGTYKGDGTVCAPNPCDCCGTDGTEMRGNMDMKNGINIADLTHFVRCILMFWPNCQECRLEMDANGSGTVNIVDITYLVRYLFQGGPAPALCP